MSKIDNQYQKIVDEEAKKLLELKLQELLEIPDYGTVTSSLGEKEVSIGFWHHEFSKEDHHIYFKTERRVFLFLYRSYISGIIFGTSTSPRLMTPEECSQYD